MERMYQEYKDVAEFRMVYIKEAHAADSNWAVPYAKEKGITEHDNYEERCTSAQMLLDDESLTIPTLIDSMDDAVNRDYRAWPDRIFVVRTDGRLAVAADQGPFGFKPALDATARWLAEFRKSGSEPEVAPPAPEEAADTGLVLGEDIDPKIIVGEWRLTMEVPGRTMEATLAFEVSDGKLYGAMKSAQGESKVANLTFDGKALEFAWTMGRGQTMHFAGAIKDDQLSGAFEGAVQCKGVRAVGDGI